MSTGKATCTIVGNLTRDPEVRFTTSNMAVVKFGVAVSTRSGKGEDAKEETSFFDVTAFGKSGEAFAKFHRKGSRVILFGRLQQEQWQDKDSGAKRSKVGVILDDWVFSGEKSAPSGNGGGGYGGDPAPSVPHRNTVAASDADDVPF